MTISILQALSNMLSFDMIDRDNWIFKLFSRWTVGIFLFASAFSFVTSYSDGAITCNSRNNLDYVNTLCWSRASVCLPRELEYHYRSDDEDDQTCKVTKPNDGCDDQNSLPHVWVSLLLLIQGALFMIPDIVWQWLEGGMLDQFGADRSHCLVSERGKGEIFNGLSKRKTRKYFFSFIFCECLHLVITFINFFVVDIFLNGLFKSKMISCKDVIFPTTVSCDYTYYQGGGGLQTDNTLCFLGQNLVNQKIYLVLWAWFMILFVAIGCMVVIRCLSICFSKYRRTTIEAYTKSKGVERLVCIQQLSESCGNIGHWFLLTQIGRNSTPYKFKNFLEEVNSAKKLIDETDTMEMQEVEESRKLH